MIYTDLACIDFYVVYRQIIIDINPKNATLLMFKIFGNGYLEKWFFTNNVKTYIFPTMDL